MFSLFFFVVFVVVVSFAFISGSKICIKILFFPKQIIVDKQINSRNRKRMVSATIFA